nr:phage tail protein [uncultured Desulfobacter sp.]
MASVITTAGVTRMDELAGNEEALVIDRMVLALIPGLDTSVADPDQQLPDPSYIVHTYNIPSDFKGYVAPDQVVYSMILGTDVGDFSFNWVGMVEAVTDTVITVTVTPEAAKWATDLSSNTTGNNLTRNVILSYQDAQNLTGITVAAETWQFDYQAELNVHISHHANPDSSDAIMKHVTDADVKVWRDHIENETIHTSFPAGTSMLFNQASAPVGWTKKSDWADNASLIVGNTYGHGGSDSPVSWSAGVAVSDHTAHIHSTTGHTLTTAEIPSHAHGYIDRYFPEGSATIGSYSNIVSNTSGNLMGSQGHDNDNDFILYINGSSDASGGGGSHSHGNTCSGGATTHSVTQNTYTPKYQIVIAATKD